MFAFQGHTDSIQHSPSCPLGMITECIARRKPSADRCGWKTNKNNVCFIVVCFILIIKVYLFYTRRKCEYSSDSSLNIFIQNYNLRGQKYNTSREALHAAKLGPSPSI